MEAVTQRVTEFIRQNIFVILIVLAGVILMLLPSRESSSNPETVAQPEPSSDYETRLEEILTKIDGVGRVNVLLSISEGERVLYEYDEDSSEDESGTDIRKEVVVISDSSRKETGLVRQVIGPVFQGAIVVCQGGDLPAVRLAVVEAVSNATGLSSDKISVLKMK